jgi:uncharacterized membrane protein YidH (DUF202 family)
VTADTPAPDGPGARSGPVASGGPDPAASSRPDPATAAPPSRPDPATAAAFPPGVQPERTALAWRRTALALAAGALVAGRVAEPLTGPLIWLSAVTGAVAALGLARAGSRRAARWAAVLAHEPARVPGPGGRTLALCAAGALVIGCAALAVVLTR